MGTLHIYFHKDFDGIASAALFNNIFDFSPYKELLRWSDIIDNADYSPRDLYENHNQYILLNKIITLSL